MKIKIAMFVEDWLNKPNLVNFETLARLDTFIYLLSLYCK